MSLYYGVTRPARRSPRLRGYDYSRGGAYFVTICVRDHQLLFGEVIEGETRLNIFGEIVAEEWLQTVALRPDVEMDVFVVMPNHFHAIIILPPHDIKSVTPPPPLGRIICGFKSSVTGRIRQLRSEPEFSFWQGRYYDRIIRSEPELNRIRQYIESNPSRWAEDEENFENVEDAPCASSSRDSPSSA